MTASADFSDSWDEFCLVGIKVKGGSFVYFDTMTEDITAMNWMKKDIETAVQVNGGRTVRRVPSPDPEGITLKVFPVDATRSAQGIVQWFHPQSTADTTDPIVVLNTLNRDTFQIVLLWTSQLPDSSLDADGIPDAYETAYRVQVINAYITDYTPSFDSKQLSAEVTFKWAPFQKDGTANKREESTASTVLDAVETFS